MLSCPACYVIDMLYITRVMAHNVTRVLCYAPREDLLGVLCYCYVITRVMSKRSAGHGCRVCGGRDGRRSRVLSRSDVSGTVWFDVTFRVPQYLH